MIDMSKPSLAGLSRVLRHRELWPAGFTWFYPNDATCAIGLSVLLWPTLAFAYEDSSPDSELARVLDLTPRQFQRIFYDADECSKTVSMDEVTPEMVAGEIEYVLTEEKNNILVPTT